MEAIRCSQIYSESAVFSQGMVAGGFTFLAADARRVDGSMSIGGAASECAQTLDGLRTALKSCGQDLENLVSLMVFLSDYSVAAEVIATLRSFFDLDRAPAMTLVGVRGVEGGCRIRMDAIAVQDSQQIERISQPDLPLAAGALCHAVRGGDLIFLSGVDAADN